MTQGERGWDSKAHADANRCNILLKGRQCRLAPSKDRRIHLGESRGFLRSLQAGVARLGTAKSLLRRGLRTQSRHKPCRMSQATGSSQPRARTREALPCNPAHDLSRFPLRWSLALTGSAPIEVRRGRSLSPRHLGRDCWALGRALVVGRTPAPSRVECHQASSV